MAGAAGSLSRTEAVLQRQRVEGLHPGACLVATVDAEPAGVASVGEARPGVAMGPATVVQWRSITKVATALRAAMAWDAGALSLDDPVELHIPEFAAGGKGPVTVRHLLTHTAGFRGADSRPSLPNWDEEVARICAEPQEEGWRPGRHAGYSARAGFLVLAEVVRRALGDDRPWERIVAEDVFAPLGMAGSHLALDKATFVTMAPQSAAYWVTPPALPEPQALGDDQLEAAVCEPGSSGRGPVEELPRLLEVLYLGGGDLLSVPAAEALTARHRSGLVDKTFGAVLDWGLGVIIDSKAHGRDLVPYGFGVTASPRTFGHGGSQSSGLLCDPEVGLVAALAFTGMCGDRAHSRRVHDVFTVLYEDLDLI
ncbi:MAG: serine hydrolase domain-containing protein [Acidimicrobiales bacterium]